MLSHDFWWGRSPYVLSGSICMFLMDKAGSWFSLSLSLSLSLYIYIYIISAGLLKDWCAIVSIWFILLGVSIHGNSCLWHISHCLSGNNRDYGKQTLEQQLVFCVFLISYILLYACHWHQWYQEKNFVTGLLGKLFSGLEISLPIHINHIDHFLCRTFLSPYRLIENVAFQQMHWHAW